MAYYSAHYGSWNDPHGVQRVEMGRDKGIDYLYHTTNYNVAIRAAQEAANESGKIVHFCKETPVAGSGMRADWREVYPVRSKIKFVRIYKVYTITVWDVIYHSGKVRVFCPDDIPETVKKFVDTSTIRKEQHDRLFNRDEVLYF